MDNFWAVLEGQGEGAFLMSVMVRLLCAAVCGGIVGFERGLKGRPAGLKTFSLVCIGAAMVMVTNEYIMLYISGGSGDAARWMTCPSRSRVSSTCTPPSVPVSPGWPPPSG